MAIVTKQILKELQVTMEDTVEYLCDEINQDTSHYGTLISGETMWGMIECLAVAKQAEMSGEFN